MTKKLILKPSMPDEDKFKSIFVNSGIGIITLKKDGTIIDSNPATTAMFGFKPQDIRGKQVGDYVDMTQRQQLVIGGKLKFEKEVNHKNGKRIWVSVAVDKVRSGFSDSFYYIIILEDISELKSKELKLQEKIEELNSIIYKASHDLKAPLASNAGLTTVALMEVHDALAREYLEKIQDSNERLNNILTSLFKVSKINSSEIDYTAINLKEVILNLLEDIKNIPGFDKIKIDLNLLNTKGFKSDLYIIKTIFQNVITNAVFYQDPNKSLGQISIDLAENNHEIIVRITDNGIGIDSKELPLIFNMFHRANLHKEGTGLGLYLAKKSLEKIGGKITVDSSIGIGSAFEITLTKK